jgi:hypothetical protein
MLRIDEANTIFGVRLNVFTAALALLLAAAYFLRMRDRPARTAPPVDTATGEAVTVTR